MTDRRKIEVFSADCPLCDDAVALVEEVAGASHDVAVLDTREANVAGRAGALGVRAVPDVAVDGELLGCCAGGGVSEETLRESLEQPAATQTANAPQRDGDCC